MSHEHIIDYKELCHFWMSLSNKLPLEHFKSAITVYEDIVIYNGEWDKKRNAKEVLPICIEFNFLRMDYT